MNKKHSPKPPRILQVRQDGAYDCVYLNKKKIRLGRTGSPEAEANFRKIQIQVLTDPTCLAPKPQQVMVDTLCLGYLEYAEEHDPGHYSAIKTAIEILLKFATGQSVESLDSRSFHRVALGNYSPSAPTEPYVRTLAHTAHHNFDSPRVVRHIILR